MNGSGKSTVLLAISLCLGGKVPAAKAKEKGAGPVASPVIRVGAKVALVEIELVNEGLASRTLPQAIYGRRIILRRTMNFTNSGRTTSVFEVVNADNSKVVAKGASPNLPELEVMGG